MQIVEEMCQGTFACRYRHICMYIRVALKDRKILKILGKEKPSVSENLHHIFWILQEFTAMRNTLKPEPAGISNFSHTKSFFLMPIFSQYLLIS